jgi:uncharacterized phage infection (PIP) family protein YhgE
MPRNPVDSLINGAGTVQNIHNKAEELRHTLDNLDPLTTAAKTLSNFADKINELDAALAKTRRRTRRLPPKQQ